MKNLEIENIYSESCLTASVIYQNATFNIKDLFSDATSFRCSSVTLITPSQTFNFAFNYGWDDEDPDFFQHSSITDLLLSRAYPNYTRTKVRNDQLIYQRECKDKIFVLTNDFQLVIFIQPDLKINEYQYNQIEKMVNQVKESDYFTQLDKKDPTTTVFKLFFINNDVISKNRIDDALVELKKHITYIEIPDQYNISSFDFSDCITDDDIMKKAKEYAINYLTPNNIIHYSQNKERDKDELER